MDDVEMHSYLLESQHFVSQEKKEPKVSIQDKLNKIGLREVKCIFCCTSAGQLCHSCTNQMMKGIRVEIDYVHRMKRQFEKIIEKRIDQIELLQMDHKEIEKKYPMKDKKENKRYMLMQKLKIMRTRVKNKKEELDRRKENVEKKYELMNEMNNEMTIKASTLEHQGQNLINETQIE